MRTIIHDLKEKDLKNINFRSDDVVLSALDCNMHCIGCFSCWIKHPKKCIINDGFSNMTEYLKKTEELILISKSRYGCYSSSVKRVLERCIGYVLPYFIIRNNEIHHESRYKKQLNLITYFYGNIDDEDKICLENLVKANSVNINVKDCKVNIIKDIKELEECIR